MTEATIEGEQLHFENPRQIINMGGPWIGELFLGQKFISDNIIIDNFLYRESLSRLFVVKYHQCSKWQRDNYFTINFLDLRNDSFYESDKKFEKAFLDRFISSDEIEIYLAFHNKINAHRSVFNLREENWRVART